MLVAESPGAAAIVETGGSNFVKGASNWLEDLEDVLACGAPGSSFRSVRQDETLFRAGDAFRSISACFGIAAIGNAKPDR